MNWCPRACRSTKTRSSSRRADSQVVVQRIGLFFKLVAQAFGQRGVAGDQRDLLVKLGDVLARDAVHEIELGVELLLGWWHALKDRAQVFAHRVHLARIVAAVCEQPARRCFVGEGLLGGDHEDVRAQVEQFGQLLLDEVLDFFALVRFAAGRSG